MILSVKTAAMNFPYSAALAIKSCSTARIAKAVISRPNLNRSISVKAEAVPLLPPIFRRRLILAEKIADKPCALTLQIKSSDGSNFHLSFF